MELPTFSYLNECWFGYGKLAVLPELLAKLGVRRPLIVTDAGLVKLGYLARLGLGEPNSLSVFDQVETNPTERSAHAGVARYREGGCDGLVAFGGGSPIDLAKIVVLLVHHEGPLEQYAIVKGGVPKIGARMPPLIAIPTTAGSGSEVGRAALVTTERHGKLGFLSPHLLPKAAILDPELTLGLPPGLTAGTGMDAISHCVETFLSNKVNPVADAIALDGFARGFLHIRAAVRDGADRQAREHLMWCSVMGGLAFQKSLGAVHSLSHPLGGLTEKKLHHGTLNALFLPHVLRFNHDAAREKMDALARRIGIANGGELPGLFAKLNEELGIPARLREMGVTKDELMPLARKAFEDHCTPTNPRALDTEACWALYEAAW